MPGAPTECRYFAPVALGDNNFLHKRKRTAAVAPMERALKTGLVGVLGVYGSYYNFRYDCREMRRVDGISTILMCDQRKNPSL